MGEHVMTAESAVEILSRLGSHGAHACVGGGWAVDALLGEQTREHSDLDLWLAAVEIEPLFVAFAGTGVDRILPWPGDRPWNFVLHDGDRLRVDLHFYEPLPTGRLHYGGVGSEETFPVRALAGKGRIGEASVRCEDPEWSVRWHTGYPPRDTDRHDVALLCRRFALQLPDDYR